MSAEITEQVTLGQVEQVTTYYLEMLSPDALIAKPPVDGLEIRSVEVPQFQFNRFLYQLIGEVWQWTDKLSWTDEQWTALVDSENHQTWVAYYQGAIAGYYELTKEGESVEILYFGLAPQFIGKGFGGYLLSSAIQSAWNWEGVERVWVHTCSLDHPNALANYQARGFSLYKTEVE